MSCLTSGALLQLLIWVVVVIAIVAIIRVLIPWAITSLGGVPGPLVQIINIVLWAVAVIVVIYIVFELLSCLVGTPGRVAR